MEHDSHHALPRFAFLEELPRSIRINYGPAKWTYRYCPGNSSLFRIKISRHLFVAVTNDSKLKPFCSAIPIRVQ